MYKDYVENQLKNRFVYEDEFGFITYNFQDEICQLEEIFIKPEFRRQGKASEYYTMCEKIGRENGMKILKGSIVIGTLGAEESMMCLFKNKFYLAYTEGMMIYLFKEIGE